MVPEIAVSSFMQRELLIGNSMKQQEISHLLGMIMRMLPITF